MNHRISHSFSYGLLLALVALPACNRSPNSMEGSIDGEEFGEVLDAIFVGDLEANDGNFKLMITNYENACQNYNFYVENQLYDIASVGEDEAQPRYLFFTVYLPDEDVADTWEVLEPGLFYPGTMSFLSGRYSEGDGAGIFVPTSMTGGAITFEDIEADGLLGGNLSVEFASGDVLEGDFEATFCAP